MMLALNITQDLEIRGYEGNDKIAGGAGNDYLDGGEMLAKFLQAHHLGEKQTEMSMIMVP